MGRNCRQHLDGDDMNGDLANAGNDKDVTEEIKSSPRKEVSYMNDDSAVVAIRLDQWKAVFLENHADAFRIWREPFTEIRVALLFNLRRDPFEKSQVHSNVYHE